MAAERTEFGVARTVCDCRACIANCRFIAGSLIPADLHRIAEYLNESDLDRFALDNLLASPGAIIFTRGGLIRIRTLVPARSESPRDSRRRFSLSQAAAADSSCWR